MKLPYMVSGIGAATIMGVRAVQIGHEHTMQLDERQAGVKLPSQDPFYQPDAGFELTASGTILKSRKLTPAVNGSVNTWQLLYRSTDSKGNPNAIVTTIFEPEAADSKKLLSVQEAQDDADVDCSPSYTFQTTGINPTALLLQASLAKGWYTMSPDYESFNASFTNGVQSGQALLDALRAALSSSNITGLDADATYAISGYSGGSIPTEWATELQPCYAPELNIAGAAIGGVVPNATSDLFNINKSPGSGLLPPGILGLTSQDVEFKAYIQSSLVPANASIFNSALTQCQAQNVVGFINQDIFSYFINGASTFTTANFTKFTEEFGIMGLRDTPTVPLYVYKGVLDQVSNITDTDALVNKYCAAGATIQYVRNATNDHNKEVIAGEPGALAFLRGVLEGKPAPNGCNIINVQ